MNTLRTKEEEELYALKAQRSRLIWFTKHPDEIALRRIDARIRVLEKLTTTQT